MKMSRRLLLSDCDMNRLSQQCLPALSSKQLFHWEVCVLQKNIGLFTGVIMSGTGKFILKAKEIIRRKLTQETRRKFFPSKLQKKIEIFLCKKLTRSLTHALLFVTVWSVSNSLSSVYRSFQARIMEQIAISAFRKKLITAHLIPPILLLFTKPLTQSYGTYDHYIQLIKSFWIKKNEIISLHSVFFHVFYTVQDTTVRYWRLKYMGCLFSR